MDRTDDEHSVHPPLPWGTARGVDADYRPGSVAFPREAPPNRDDDA